MRDVSASVDKIACLYKEFISIIDSAGTYAERRAANADYWKRIKAVYYHEIAEWWKDRSNGLSEVSVRLQSNISGLEDDLFGWTTIYNRQGMLKGGAVNKITIDGFGHITSCQAITDAAFLSPADTEAALFIRSFQRAIVAAVQQPLFKPGDQIIYVPTHASGDLSHCDCELGFVTSVRGETVFCRYFSKFGEGLRTKANSEGCDASLLRHYTHHLQSEIDTLYESLYQQ